MIIHGAPEQGVGLKTITRKLNAQHQRVRCLLPNHTNTKMCSWENGNEINFLNE